MGDLFAARSQMAMSLAFHVVFAAIGIGLPLLMLAAEVLRRRTGDAEYLALAVRWGKGAAILFAVGAVSGTILSFELGLLWPEFMARAGAVVGMPFALEGFAFFAEAIFLGVALYGRDRVSPRVHLAATALAAASAAASGVFVMMANAWMNFPAGFRWEDGRATDLDPVAAMFNPGWASHGLHMILAAYLATAAGVAGVHAFMLLRDRRNAFHRRAFGIAMPVFCACALVQPFSGDWSSRVVAERQPAKLAAMEAQFRTERGAPLRIGGLPDPAARTVRWDLEIPKMLSVLAYGDADAEVRGLDAFPPDERPDVRVVHAAFQAMIACGGALFVIAAWAVARRARRKDLAASRPLLVAVALSAPLGFVATEAGWFVTEVGRQPWIIYGRMRTAEAVTPMRGLESRLVLFTAVYVLLSVAVVWLMRRQIRAAPKGPARKAAA